MEWAASPLIAPPKWLYALGGCVRWRFSCSGSGNLQLAYGPAFLKRFITPTPTTLFIICSLSSFNCFLTSITLPAVFSVRCTLLHLLPCSAELCPSDTCLRVFPPRASILGQRWADPDAMGKGYIAWQCIYQLTCSFWVSAFAAPTNSPFPNCLISIIIIPFPN